MKSYRLLLISIFFLLISLTSTSQNVTSIDQIKFEGNRNTDTKYLESIVTSKINYPFDQSVLDEDIEILKNLPSIANVECYTEITNEGYLIHFIIDERKTKFPILNLGGIKNNLWFGLGIIENNLKGKSRQFLIYYQNTDQRHSAELFFKIPQNKSGNYGFSSGLRKWSSNEPLYFQEGPVNYLYDNLSLNLSIIKNFGIRKTLELGGTFFQERYRQAEFQVLNNPPGPLKFSTLKYLSKIQFFRNKLNFSFFYVSGFSIQITGQNVLNFSDSSFFNSVTFEGKLFKKPNQYLNFATRIVLGLSTNNESPFAPFVADNHVNIRGIGNRIDRGTAQAVFNFETRITCFHIKNWASQFVVFSDFGTWRLPGGNLIDIVDNDNFRHFVGLGLRFHYQNVFGATFRLDYSFDIFNPIERGFVFGLGQYF